MYAALRSASRWAVESIADVTCRRMYAVAAVGTSCPGGNQGCVISSVAMQSTQLIVHVIGSNVYLCSMVPTRIAALSTIEPVDRAIDSLIAM